MHPDSFCKLSVIICLQKRVFPPEGGLISKIIPEVIFSAVALSTKLDSPGMLTSGIVISDAEYSRYFTLTLHFLKFFY